LAPAQAKLRFNKSNTPTKEHKPGGIGAQSQVWSLVCETEILSEREFLRQRDFSTASDYHNRLSLDSVPRRDWPDLVRDDLQLQTARERIIET